MRMLLHHVTITMMVAVEEDEEDQLGIKILRVAILLPVVALLQVTIATVVDPGKGTLAMAATATLPPIILMVLFAFDAISQGIMRPAVPIKIIDRCCNN